MADAITFSGTTIAVSANLPATYDDTGFAALTYTDVGEVTTAPGSGGKTFEDVSWTVLADSATRHRKGTSDQAEQTMEIIDDRDDGGQDILKTALDSPDEISFKVTYNNGEIDYFQGLVTGYEGTGGDANTLRQSTVTFRRNYQGTIEVAAP